MVHDIAACMALAFVLAGQSKPGVDENLSPARAALDKHDRATALACCNTAIQSDPKNTGAYLLRGVIFMSSREMDKAIEDFSAVIHLNSLDPEPLVYRASAFVFTGDIDKALADCDQAIRVNPWYVPAYQGRMAVHQERGELDKALDDCNGAIRLDPGDAPSYANRASVRMVKGDLDMAVKDINVAIRLDPASAGFYHLKGRIYFNKKNLDQAIEHCTEAIRLDQSGAIYWCDRADYRLAKGDYQRAAEDCAEAIRLEPSSSWRPYAALAEIRATAPMADLREGGQAVILAKTACNLTGWKEPGALSALAAAFAEKGEFAEAVKWQKEALKARTSPAADGPQRLSLYEQGKPFRRQAR